MKTIYIAATAILVAVTQLVPDPGAAALEGHGPMARADARAVDLRPGATDYSTTMRGPDGSYTTRISPVPVNYRDANGDYQPINSRLVASANRAFLAENIANSFSAKIPRNPRTTPVRLAQDGAWVTMRMHGTGSSTPRVVGSRSIITDVREAARVTYEVVNSGVKETIRLNKPPAAPLSYHYTIDASRGLAPKLMPDGSIHFLTASGDAIFSMPQGTMVDSASTPADSHDVGYDLRPGDKAWRLTVTPDPAWLSSPDRVYPVLIDPSLTNQPASRDCWLNQAAPTTSYCGDPSSFIRVGRAATTTASRRRGLLNFDVAGIPSNAQVTSAAVSLYLDASQSQSSAMANYAFYVPGKAFASPTWNDSGLSGSWSGGSPGTTAYGTRPLNGQSGGYTTFSGLTPVVQTWVAGTAARRGLELMQVGENVANTLYFYSSSANSTNNGKRPYLEVTYTLPPQPADPYGGEEGSYTSVSPTVVFDSRVSGSVQAGTPRTVTASIPNVVPDEVDRMVVVVQVLDWTSSGSVSVYGADASPPSTPTVSFAATETVGKVKSATIEVEPSLVNGPGSITISRSGSGAPRVLVLARGWYGWASEIVTDDGIPAELTPSDPAYAEILTSDMPSVVEPEQYLRDDLGQPLELLEANPEPAEECLTTQPPGEPAPTCGVQYSLADDPTEVGPDTEQTAAAVVELKCSREGPPWKLKSRTFACRKSAVAWNFGGGQRLGLKITETLATSARGKSVSHRWQVRLKENSTVVDWFHVKVTAHCTLGCTDTANPTATDIVGTGEPVLAPPHTMTAQANIGSRTSSLDQGRTQQVSTYLTVKITWLLVNSSEQDLTPSPHVRCDNLRYLNADYGCVLPAARGVLELRPSTDGSGESAELISFAQATMNPSPGSTQFSNGYPLSRLRGKTERRSNRRAARALCRTATKPSGTSCDEFPFASSYEGCATSTVTTGPKCIAYWVNAADNSKVGSLLARFFQQQRILDVGRNSKFDGFFVTLT